MRSPFTHAKQTIISTNNDTRQYIANNYLPTAPSEEINRLLILYPDDVTQGSPFDTGNENALTPEYKRLAAFHGDAIFVGPRRFFLQQRSDKQPTWSFCAYGYNLHYLYDVLYTHQEIVSKRSKSLPDLGSVRFRSQVITQVLLIEICILVIVSRPRLGEYLW